MVNESRIPVHQSCQAFTNPVEGNESILEYFRRRVMVFLRSVMRKYRRAGKTGGNRPNLPTWAQASMDVQAGNRVRVRTHSEIAQTLNERGFLKGCKFMEQMARYCGHDFLVAGKVEKFYDEARCRTLQCKNLVLLDSVYCDGTVVGGCDRMCFLFWRTEWLEKLD
jgi:hypothetical protein